MPDISWKELIQQAEEAASKGINIYQKWTCGACGERCTSDKVNTLHTSMIHTDCLIQPGYETDTVKSGGGLLILIDNTKGAK